jgi:hypothetical protein
MRDGTLRLLGCVAALGVSPAAWALPWNIDMVDSDAVKAYEQVMRPLPEGTMSQPNLLTPISYRRNFVREAPEGQALTPRAMGLDIDLKNDKVLATGQRMYEVYCTPCHGDGQALGPVAAPGRYPAVAILKGEGGRVAPRTDGHLYLTIRNGGGIMPAYGWAMTDAEMWSLVGYLRKEMAAGVAPASATVAPANADGSLLPADGTPGAAPPAAPSPAAPAAPATAPKN